ncbi:MAG TPA: FxSxx-COOH system tetratricopeptide repeat protein [Tepidisphaeraceae bacterium]|nr:FxSxx-COOH system tetratricopeptide repeat protein [Tepidisphaeraceae bacterium]
MSSSTVPAASRADQQLAPIWNVPYNRNPHFLGRDEDLNELHVSMGARDPRTRVQAIHGLGGVGKSQLALEYAYRYASEYQIVWWLSADEPATLALMYSKLGQRLGMRFPDGAKLDDIRHHVRRVLNGRHDWLLIFDNAAGPEDVQNYIPQERTGQVLITSRNPNWGAVARPFPLRGMKRADAVAFLLSRTGRQGRGDDATRLAMALGDLPLALEQAAACVEQTGISFNDYLKRFETHWAELLKEVKYAGDYPDSVAMTWELSFRQVQEDMPAAADLLSLCSFLHPDEISRSLLREGAPRLPDSLARTILDVVSFDEAVAALRRYSLIDTTEKSFSIHRLVGALARDRLSDEERLSWATDAVNLVRGSFQFDSQDLGSWERCAQLLPHALAAAGHAESLGAAPRTTVGILEDAGRYLQKRAQFAEAKYVLERAMALCIAFYGENHPRVAAVANNLGRVHNELGETEEALACYERGLNIDRATYGDADVHVATIVNNYAVSLHSAGRVEEAKAQFEWALQVYELHYGSDHPKVASVVNNLGYVLHSAGDLEGAAALFQRSLALAETVYHPNHPIVGHILSNLGLVARLRGEFAQSKSHLERALAINEGAYGADHPAVARTSGHLGELYVALGQLPQARAQFERALRIDELIYGPSHIAVFNRLNQLGRVLKEMGEFERARKCLHRAADILAAAKAPAKGSPPTPSSPADSGAPFTAQPMKPSTSDELTPMEVGAEPQPALADLEPLADIAPGFIDDGEDLPKLKGDEDDEK